MIREGLYYSRQTKGLKRNKYWFEDFIFKQRNYRK